MLTWNIDRLVRSGPACALVTLIMPMLLAMLVDTQSAVENVLGIVMIASGLVFVGSIAGSTVTSGLGVVLFFLGTVVAEVPAWVMAVVGIGMFTTMVIHDLAGSFHRAPLVNGAVWANAALTTAGVAAASALAFAISYAIGNLAVWQSIVVPFGIAAIGFGAKLAADSHRTSALKLTAKRVPGSTEDR